LDDLECVAGLVAEGAPRSVKRSKVQAYRFPPQETKLRAGSPASAQVEDLPPGDRRTVDIVSLDPAAGTAELKFGPKWCTIPSGLDLVPGDPLKKDVLKAALARVVAETASDGTRYPATVDLLKRAAPRVKGIRPGAPLVEDGADLVEATAQV